MNEVIVEREAPKGILFRLLANTVAIYVTAAIVPGVHVSGILGAIIAAVVLTLVNSIVKPILIFFTLPITLLTLGVFILVINALSIAIAAWLSGSAFDIDGFGAAFLAWIFVSICNWAFTALFRRRKVTVVRH